MRNYSKLHTSNESFIIVRVINSNNNIKIIQIKMNQMIKIILPASFDVIGKILHAKKYVSKVVSTNF